ncbi:DUF3139 domain-containing protein [Paenibacillus dokdonensis]|uniref:DUF3139 domain-containing protein n=1 Tax=Paenibacillus dokdonensis TaxID=2567944 RepID=A0ABU6GF48_9BACL|nr:DUF3139 domain-containing protein [Paenibacillus dokdonensis]MEC0238353.1 DUF3139 domain-containing protein [Paenibacillus dokdonensis]
MLKKKLIVTVIIVVCIGGYLGYWGYSKAHEYQLAISDLEKEVVAHLKEEYPKASIKEVESGYSTKGKEYYINIIYSDEPNVRYSYTKENNKIKLWGTTNSKGQYMDETFWK